MNALQTAAPIVNAMTVDVEDYFHVSNFAGVIRPEEWPKFESRVELNTLRLLDIFAAHHVSATCFMLGWVAERHPSLVRAIQDAGHEVACHGYGHRLVYQSTPREFRADVRRAKQLLEDLSGTEVVGYRAPSFSIIKSCLWALDILGEEGFRYDSSIFPIWRQRYGIPNANRFPHRWTTRNGGALVQFPVSTFRACGVNLPLGGGGYFRVLPYALSRWAIGQLNRAEGRPAVMYIHSWEIDAEQPRVPGPLLARIRHYVNLHSTEAKLRRLLTDFPFATLGSLLENMNGSAKWSMPSPKKTTHPEAGA
jgi:polysaccharide deacetylase family protein (PEP-CTERM system associated)